MNKLRLRRVYTADSTVIPQACMPSTDSAGTRTNDCVSCIYRLFRRHARGSLAVGHDLRRLAEDVPD